MLQVHLVVLRKDEGSGLGFSIAGGVDLEQREITVSIVILLFSVFRDKL